jgi:hypothetical protein
MYEKLEPNDPILFIDTCTGMSTASDDNIEKYFFQDKIGGNHQAKRRKEEKNPQAA